VKRLAATWWPIPRIPSTYYVLFESFVPQTRRLTSGKVLLIQFIIFGLPVSYLRRVKIQIHKQKNYIISSVVLFGCETWCLNLREEHRLEAPENITLREISTPTGNNRIQRTTKRASQFILSRPSFHSQDTPETHTKILVCT
jgi:hypothetical protein